MNKALTIELIHENPVGSNYFYSTLKLPALEHEIRDAYQKARLCSKDDVYEISIIECQILPEIMFKRLDSPTLDELNFFAKRISSLSEDERLVFSVICPQIIEKQDEPVSMKDLINCTYGLNEVMMVSAVRNDMELGAFVIENEINEDVAAIPESSLYLLDRGTVGALQRIVDGGVYVNDKYILAGSYELKEIYDGISLPEVVREKWFAFRLEISAPPIDDESKVETKWITLPISKCEAKEKARELGVRKIEDCVYYAFESSIPQISEDQFNDMKDFYKLNYLAETMPFMSPEEQIKFKAVLEAEKVSSVDDIIDIQSNLSDYQISVNSDDEQAFFKEYISHHLDIRFDTKWLNNISVRYEGEMLLERLDAKMTDYGVISARHKNLFDLVPFDEDITEDLDEDINMKMGGM